MDREEGLGWWWRTRDTRGESLVWCLLYRCRSVTQGIRSQKTMPLLACRGPSPSSILLPLSVPAGVGVTRFAHSTRALVLCATRTDREGDGHRLHDALRCE